MVLAQYEAVRAAYMLSTYTLTYMHTCLVAHVQAWLGITNLGEAGTIQPVIERAIYLIVSNLHLHHEINTACLLACLALTAPSSTNARPAFHKPTGWALGAHASAFQA